MIYIHVPFCHRKCTYCAFYSVRSSEFGVRNYVEALLREMEERKGEQAHPIKTVYFGGGTPSILPIDLLARIVEGLRHCFDLSQVEEVTLEANPEDLTPEYLASLRTLGVNRLSVGIQSLDDKVLRLLNRRHTAQQALEAVENAHRAGFDNISVDFIYGIKDLKDFKVFKDMVSHVSVYALTVEPGTALAVQVEQGRVTLPGEEEVVRQYHALHRQLEEAGFRQYEVSNYARPGFESKHNSRYWDRTPYLGLGPGAHSFDGKKRQWNNPDGTVGEETLTEADAYNELLMTSLRTVRGLPAEADAYNELLMTSLRTVRGLPAEAVRQGQKQQLQSFVDCNWLVYRDGFYRPTTEGLLRADGMAAALFV